MTAVMGLSSATPGGAEKPDRSRRGRDAAAQRQPHALLLPGGDIRFKHDSQTPRCQVFLILHHV